MPGTDVVPLAGPIPWRALHNAELRHGYTLASANRLSMVAVRNTWGLQQADRGEWLATAWFAIVEHIYTAEDRPEVTDVLRAATRAVHAQARQDGRTRGHTSADGQTGARFECYWWTAARHTPGPEERVTERLALAQIWPRLNPRHQQALTALAAYDDHSKAAAALGKPYKTFASDLSQARRAFLALWHEGETPSRPWGNDRRRTSTRAGDSITYRTIVARRRERARRAAHSARADLGVSDHELIRRYQQGESIAQLAASLHKSWATVKDRLQARGVYTLRQRRRTEGAATFGTSAAPLPEIVARYEAYLGAKTSLTPQVRVQFGRPVLSIGERDSVLTLNFSCHKDTWLVGSIQVRTCGETQTFAQGDLAKALAAFGGLMPAN